LRLLPGHTSPGLRADGPSRPPRRSSAWTASSRALGKYLPG